MVGCPPYKFSDYHGSRALNNVLLRVESLRTLDRMRHSSYAEEEIAGHQSAVLRAIQSVRLIPLSERVLARAAEPLPTILKTADAIHLASALLWRESERQPLTFLTHDVQLARAARAMNFEVLG